MSEIIVLENSRTKDSAIYQVKGIVGVCVEVTTTHDGWMCHKGQKPYDYEGHTITIDELLNHRDFAYAY